MSLSGKVALITGGGSGIGLGIARVLGEKGARLALAQRRLKMAEQAAEQLRGVEAIALKLDIQNREDVYRAMSQVIEKFGAIDILVNNASITGIGATSPFLETSPEQLDQIVDINLKGTFYCSQAAARWMVDHKRGGSIIHVSSVAAYAAQEFASVYCATKAAQVSLARTMGLELAPHGIRVNCIAPGDIYTETSAEIVSELKDSDASGRYFRWTPLGRRGRPEEIGHAVAFLASDESSFVIGTTLLVDGGFLAY